MNSEINCLLKLRDSKTSGGALPRPPPPPPPLYWMAIANEAERAQLFILPVQSKQNRDWLINFIRRRGTEVVPVSNVIKIVLYTMHLQV
jgi:hypothetical protein